MHTIRSDRPLPALTYRAVRYVHDACNALGIDYVIVGASARDILLTHVFGIPLLRATRDVDVAVSVSDWPTFELIMSWLVERRTGWSRSSTKRHQLLYRDTSMTDSVPLLDVVPFGGIEDENPPRTIAWPPDRTTIMNVAGFAEALRAATRVQVADDFVVPVASIPGLVVLKVFAWAERHTVNAKDADDLLALLRTYADAGNLDRLYTGDMSIMEACDYNPELAGAYLLGMDVATMTGAATRTRMLDTLRDGRIRDSLILDMARSRTRIGPVEDDTLTTVDTMLAQFVAGLGWDGSVDPEDH